MPRRSLFPLLAFLVACLSLTAAEPPVRRRGNLLRKEVVKTEAVIGFRGHLLEAKGSYPKLQFQQLKHLTEHLIDVYQVLIEVGGGDETNIDRIEYRVVPGDFIKDNPSIQERTEIIGLLNDEKLTINGVSVKTDKDGIVNDTQQVLLSLFDDLSQSKQTVTVKHEKFGVANLKISRNLVTRYTSTSPRPVNLEQTDILASLKLDFEPKKQTGRDGLVFTVDCPKTLSPGQSFPITIHVKNNGDLPTSSLMASIFSRHSWINGKNFYFGAVPAKGDKVSFTRVFVAPKNLSTKHDVFAGISFWDILGNLKGRGIPLTLPIQATEKK